jgi:alpha-galactosidase
MMQRTAMSSFSDAHESWNIPIIARQLHHLMPPRQSQIWAVLHPDDTPERFMYSLTATLYGRMCLSGPVHDLSDAQMETVKEAVAFYQAAAPTYPAPEGSNHCAGSRSMRIKAMKSSSP